MLKIHDIKPLVEIPDHSIYFYYGLIVLAFLLVLLIIYLIYLYIKSKKPSKQKLYYRILKDIDFSNQKQSAYTISKYGRLLIKDDRQKILIEDLINELEEFKYKKEITKNIPNHIKAKYETFLESLDVR